MKWGTEHYSQKQNKTTKKTSHSSWKEILVAIAIRTSD